MNTNWNNNSIENFSKNIVGYQIDNSQGQSVNNGHGSVANCVFNHTNGGTGNGIELLGVSYGFIFTGCQIFYSKILCDNCTGILFDSMNCGNSLEITVSGGQVVVFSDCIFGTAPSVTLEDDAITKWNNCYTYDGTAVSAA